MSANGVTPAPTVVSVPQPAAEKPPEPTKEIATATAQVPAALVVDDGAPISPFAGSASFALAQRMATALASSTVVPKEYQGNVGNCLIAIEMAGRIGMPAFMVMQNMVPIYGKPSWTSKFLIGIVNASPEWTSIRWRWVGDKTSGDDWGVRAVATDKRTGEECVGPLVDIAMAKAEGWYHRTSQKGDAASKWPTMPEVMLMYRSAAFWSRMYAPEKTLGLTTEEVEDIGGTVRPGSIDVTHGAPASVSPSRTLSDVASRSREQREAQPGREPATAASVPVPSVVAPAAPAAPVIVKPAKPEDSISRPTSQPPKGQATLPIATSKPRRGVRVEMADGTPVDLDAEDAAAMAAVEPTAKEITEHGPPPISTATEDDDDVPEWAGGKGQVA